MRAEKELKEEIAYRNKQLAELYKEIAQSVKKYCVESYLDDVVEAGLAEREVEVLKWVLERPEKEAKTK